MITHTFVQFTEEWERESEDGDWTTENSLHKPQE